NFNRRNFFGALGLAGVASTATLNGQKIASVDRSLATASIGRLSPQQRQAMAFQMRRDAALFHREQPIQEHVSNGDKSIPGSVAVFSKTLPHNNLGEVDPVAYEAYLGAIASGKGSDFDAIPMGGPGKLSNPQSSYAFAMEGPDCQLPIVAAPPA